MTEPAAPDLGGGECHRRKSLKTAACIQWVIIIIRGQGLSLIDKGISTILDLKQF